MGINADGANVFIGRGKMRFDRFTAAGLSTGLRFLGNGNSLTIATEDEVKELLDSTTAGSNILKQALIRRKVTVSIALNEETYENLAMSTMGDESYYAARAGGAVTAYDLGIAYTDRFYKFTDDGPIAASPAPVIKMGSTTITAVTDYTLDLARGTVYIIANGTTTPLANGTNKVNVAYTTSAIVVSTNKKVIGGSANLIEGMFQYIPDSNQVGPKWDVDVWRIDFTPDGEFGLISDDFGEFKLKGLMVADTLHPGELYRLTPR
jgi:hypothetical protein